MEEIRLTRLKDRDQVWVSRHIKAHLVMAYAAFSRITLILLKISRAQTMEELRWTITTEKTLRMMNSIKMKVLTQMNTSLCKKKSSQCSHRLSRFRTRHPQG